MHDLRQRHCPDPYADAALLVAKIGVFFGHCQSESKINDENKITHEVKLLTCDLM
jgi:hypothetical protein